MDQILAESDALRKHHGLSKKHFWVSPADNLHLALAKGLNSSQITEIISGICNEVPSENILVKELKILARSGPQEAYRLLEIISLT